MKRTIVLAGGLVAAGLLLAAGVALEPVGAQAQAQAAQGSRPPFLFLDVQKVFTDYKKFQELTANLKKELDEKEKQLVELEQQIKTKGDSAQNLTSQEDRNNLQKEMQLLKLDYDQIRTKARQDFLAKEADIYATVYDEVYAIVKGYCEKYKFIAVFRVQDPESKDRSAPNRIIQTLNREVVFHDSTLDLTKVITDGLNQQWEKTQAANPSATEVR